MTHEFTIIIERDPESDWLVGSVAELPGCYSHAPTLAELEPNMREAIEVYLETLGDERDFHCTPPCTLKPDHAASCSQPAMPWVSSAGSSAMLCPIIVRSAPRQLTIASPRD